MVGRSDFQGAMLFFAASTLLASILIGNDGLSTGEVSQAFKDALARHSPAAGEIISEAGGDSAGTALPRPLKDVVPEAFHAWIQTAATLFMSIGAGIGSLGAALWHRLQNVALMTLATVSGHAGYETVKTADTALSSTEMAAVILQLLAFGAAALGLGSMAKNFLFGTGKWQQFKR